MSSVCARAAATVSVAVLSLLLFACGGDPQTPADRVRAVIDAMQRAVETGDAKEAARWLHTDYADDRHARKMEAVGSLYGYMRRHSGIHLFTVTRTVEVAPGDASATAVVYVAMSGVPVESVETLVAVRADLYRFDVTFGLDGDEWRIRHSRWARADLSVL